MTPDMESAVVIELLPLLVEGGAKAVADDARVRAKATLENFMMNRYDWGGQHRKSDDSSRRGWEKRRESPAPVGVLIDCLSFFYYIYLDKLVGVYDTLVHDGAEISANTTPGDSIFKHHGCHTGTFRCIRLK